MASYLVLKPAGSRPGPEAIRFIRDGFSLFALIMPLIWMLYHRLWLQALGLLAVEAALAFWISETGSDTAGALAVLALSLVVALESGDLRLRHLLSRGWVLDRVITAGDRATAEEIYFSAPEWESAADMAPPSRPAAGTARPGSAPALGLFEFGKGR